MPLEYEMRQGALAWVKNPFTGVISYVVDVRDKNFAFTLGADRPAPVIGPPPLDRQGIEQSRGACPFCPGNETQTSPEVMRLVPDEFPGWHGEAASPWVVRVFNNLFPRIPVEFTGGVNESYILVEDPRHFQDDARSHGDLMYTAALGSDHFVQILRILARVTGRARRNPAVGAVVVRKNQGRESGASQPHVHHQVIGAPQLPVLAAEMNALQLHPLLWEELIELAEKCGLVLFGDDDLTVYLSPIGTFPHSYDLVMPRYRGTLDELDEPALARFGRALHQVLDLLGPQPLDYEIHQFPGLVLHAHVSVRRFPYSNVAGTLNLPQRMLEMLPVAQRRLLKR